MKDTIVNNPTLPIKRAYKKQVILAHQTARAAGKRPLFIPDFHEICSSLARTKAQQCPSVPANLNQVNIVGPWAQRYFGERYLLDLDNVVGIALFSTNVELNALGDCFVIYVDGTFRTAPAPYKQVFTVHGEVNNRVINLATALLSGKTHNISTSFLIHF